MARHGPADLAWHGKARLGSGSARLGIDQARLGRLDVARTTSALRNMSWHN